MEIRIKRIFKWVHDTSHVGGLLFGGRIPFKLTSRDEIQYRESSDDEWKVAEVIEGKVPPPPDQNFRGE